MIFPIPKIKYRLIKELYENEQMNISALLKRTNAAQKRAYIYIDELISSGIVKEKMVGKKPVLRNLAPNFESEEGRLIFSLVEAEKNKDFFRKNAELKGAFAQFAREVNGLSLIFGSFAKNNSTKESDIDIAVIGQNLNSARIENISEKCFVTLKNKASIRLFKTKEFTRQLANREPLATQIKQNHIIISNYIKWIELLSQCEK